MKYRNKNRPLGRGVPSKALLSRTRRHRHPNTENSFSRLAACPLERIPGLGKDLHSRMRLHHFLQRQKTGSENWPWPVHPVDCTQPATKEGAENRRDETLAFQRVWLGQRPFRSYGEKARLCSQEYRPGNSYLLSSKY